MNLALHEFCCRTIGELEFAQPREWAVIFVERRMELQRRFLKGLVLSTTHGTDIYWNIIYALQGVIVWEEKGELEDNFRKFIRIHAETQPKD